jgi:hypothetical protein
MPTVEELVAQTESKDSVERIAARVELLRTFPHQGDFDLKSELFSALREDVATNREKALAYVSGLPEIDRRAYALTITSHGFYVNERKVPPALKVQKRVKARFVRQVSSLLDKLGSVKDEAVRLRAKLIIASEGEEETALRAVDSIVSEGFNMHIQRTEYERYSFYSVPDILVDVINWSNSDRVKRRAITCLGDVPDTAERGEKLIKLITDENSSVALAAAEVYRAKGGNIHEEPAETIMSIITARHPRNFKEALRARANQKVVETAFDWFVEALKPEERLTRIFGLTQETFVSWVHSYTGSYPDGLYAKVRDYLNTHFDEIASVSDKKRREAMWFELTRQKGDAGVKALNCLAQSGDGVSIVAQLYGSRRETQNLGAEAQEKLKDWAFRYVRQFADLPDREVASAALRRIGGWPEHESYGEGVGKIENGSGLEYDQIALQEIARLPAPPTEKSRLLAAFQR